MPTGGRSWTSLLHPEADADEARLYALLDAGTVELRQDAAGNLFLRDPSTGDYAQLPPTDCDGAMAFQGPESERDCA